ncbi:hypothetical protein Tco_1080223 [Tanacetum coccineum]|uniref:Uncharacterized protein n=1 Tax=Tanacetum coccineum TaxID=301880 RepID=A0ABQ5HU33_9ASTR
MPNIKRSREVVTNRSDYCLHKPQNHKLGEDSVGLDELDNVVEEEDEEQIRFLGGNSSSGTKKYRGSNSSDGDNIGDGVKIAGEVIGSGDEIGTDVPVEKGEDEKLYDEYEGPWRLVSKDSKQVDEYSWVVIWNSGNKDGRRSGKQEDSNALVTIDGEGVDWTSHLEEKEDYALMACNSSGLDTEVTSYSNECKEYYAKLKKLYDAPREQLSNASIEIKAYTQGLKKVEAQLVAHQQGQLWYEEKIRFMKIDLDDKTNVLTYHKKLQNFHT